MSIRELEYGALSPARVSAQMKKGPNGTKIAPSKNRAFRAPQFNHEDEMSLIPGGRYLLTGSYNPHCGVSLWDLGTNAACALPLSPIATIPEGISTFGTCPTPDGSGVLVSTYFVDAGTTHTTVYEIYPSAAEPQFCRKGNLKLRGVDIIHSQTGYHFVSLDSTQVLTFWDIESNKWFTWRAPFKIEEFLLLESQLIILNQTQITLWEIPLLKSMARNDIPGDEFAKHFPPILNLGHSFPTGPNIPSLFSVPSQWWPTPHTSIILGSVAPKDGVSEMTLHRLDLGKLASDSHITEIAVLLPIPLRMVIECECLYGLRFCNKDLCQRWGPHKDVLISLLPIPSSHEEEKRVVTTRILFSGPIFDFDFCPASGRLVVATEEDVIRVLDFIAPIDELS